ncbi:SMC family ATPase [uncultured Nocardioides sp.]|uniref:SMC family ATPase n=1 Tax=uncultured Nocardioides sp. TaxID=198441 RepID=UPI0030FA4B09
MRLHRLEVTAFGPFPATVEVDLDRLSESGLFLLTGPTGAGKTSVLDAVCFALYGDVPGERSSAKRLRCDQAAPGVAPRVELELTVSGRRFRLVRSPAWERPKKRGTGTTTEPAHVVLAERRDEQWETLSTRLDETGYLVGDLLGMNLVQFTQVALLPQGRFQAFLRARSDERHRLLQQLFRTGRFEQVEAWLKERRVRLRRRSDEVEEQVADLTSRLSEAARADLPGACGDEAADPAPQLGLLADDGSLQAWADDLTASTAQALTGRKVDLERAAAAEHEAARVLDLARERIALHERRSGALAEQRALVDAAPRQQANLERLAGARRAAVVVPLARLARRADERVGSAASHVDACERAARLTWGDEHPLDDPAALAATHEEARATLSTLEAVRPRLRRLHDTALRLDDLRGRHERDLHQVDELEAELARLPAAVHEAREQHADLLARAERSDGLADRLEVVQARIDAHDQVTTLTAAAEQARLEWLAAREAAAQAHEHLLGVREARIEAMAAELAGALAVGGCCPVCGSAEHPAKAVAAPGAADAGAERAAQRDLDDAKTHEHLLDGRHRDLLTRLEVERARTGGQGRAELLEESARLRTELTEAESARAARGTAAQRVTALEQSLADTTRRHTALLADRAGREAAIAALDQEVTATRDEVRDVLVDAGAEVDGDEADKLHERLESLLEHHRARSRAAQELSAALDALGAARQAAHEAHHAAQQAAQQQAFADVDAAEAAYVDEAEVRALEQRTSEHQRRLDRVEQVLAEVARRLDELPDAPAHSPTHPDPELLPGLQAAHQAARRHAEEVGAEVATLAARHERLDGLAAALAERLRAWAPLRADLALATRLGTFVEGRSADNHLQMRLSAYVLAYRLSQVVAAANERLARMSEHRYSLEHTAQRGAGETRGGLSLRVRDDWSGEARDPATLSGGETFVVSLALALGLADVITAEAGGAELDTLFVDEGFGSLDAETLEDVMDVLDSLREGGRVVGVVSHVAEMRDRIPTQLRVHKSRGGSSLVVAAAGL